MLGDGVHARVQRRGCSRVIDTGRSVIEVAGELSLSLAGTATFPHGMPFGSRRLACPNGNI